LTRDGIIGNVAKVTVKDSINHILIIYGLISKDLMYLAIDNFNRHDNLSALLFLLFAVFLVYGIINSINNSAAPRGL